MSVEKLIGFLSSNDKYPVFKILLLKFSHLLIHEECLCKIFKFPLTFGLYLGINFDEDFKISGHHICQGVSIGLDFFELVVDFLDLLLSFGFTFVLLKEFKFCQQNFQLFNSFFPVHFDI